MLLDDFEFWAKKQPQATALVSETHTTSYLELWTEAVATATSLTERGVRHGDRVALLLPKDEFAIANMLGVLLIGASYVPLDPRAPVPRLVQILDACAPRLLIASERHLARLASAAPTYAANLETLGADAARHARSNSPSSINAAHDSRRRMPIAPEATAYILFTSGSTGQPKGVVISHEAAHAFVDWARRTFELGPQDRLASFAPLSFDLSIFDIFGGICSGSSVLLVTPEQMLHPKELVEQLVRWRTTLIYAVPSTITLLERDGALGGAGLTSLRQLLYAGEPFPIVPLIAAFKALPGVRFFNLFGPTETNVCTFHPIEEAPEAEAGQVPIGRACDHLQVELLDELGAPVVRGEEGELCVTGPSVMTGYFGDPQGTEAAFYPGKKFADQRRRYRTGDRAVEDENGLFWFRGRRDRLVKRRGYRIEMGDIEACLRKHPEVLEAAALDHFDGTEMQLLTFVSLRNRGLLSPLILRAHCGSLLPPYMVPDSVEILDELPRTLTGKVDMQMLRQRGRDS